MHLVPQEVKARVIGKLLTPWILRLRDVFVSETLENGSHISYKEQGLLPLNAAFDLLNIEICIVEHLWKQLVVLVLNLVFVEDLVRYLCLEQLGVMICIEQSCYQQKLHVDVPGLGDWSEQISCMNRQIITFVVVHRTLEVAEESWVEEILCLIELLNYLVDRVEFEELLGHVVGHSKVPSMNYHDLLIKLRELQFL